MVHLCMVAYVALLFSLPLWIDSFTSRTLVIFVLIILPFLPIIFVMFQIILEKILLRPSKVKNRSRPWLILVAFSQRLTFPITIFNFFSIRRPPVAEADYAYVKHLTRFYINPFLILLGALLLYSSIVIFVASPLFNSFFKFTVAGTTYVLSEVLLALWILWVLLVIGQNAIYYWRIFRKDF